ncbi:(-)-trans-carveol dehydrogenase [Frankia canadensis]|uniref:(-)-trans-carveol dehydrogenase n=1 Tax=Frankia canadensis TaxID=1836972 RepID=A0A2I2KXQ4_9ACTN|nr:(-)-trans-carveol dehydrogenase [Frankia canadensis]SOU57726.1 (-)-trans-carveol dehydrogenase [Frankia canadensis]
MPYPLATPDDLKETVRAVEALGRRVVARQADVRDIDQLLAAVADGVGELGRLDIVCANAGIVPPFVGPTDPASRSRAFAQVVDINLTGVFRTVEACKQAVIDSGDGGSIIVTSSLAGLRAIGAGGGYGESKHGLVGLVRCYAQELAPHHIRVNSIHPTNVRTPMLINEATMRAFRPDLEHPTEDDALEGFQTLNLLPVPYIEAADVSDTVLFLASAESRFITGAAIPVDAGGAVK